MCYVADNVFCLADTASKSSLRRVFTHAANGEKLHLTFRRQGTVAASLGTFTLQTPFSTTGLPGWAAVTWRP